MKDVAMLAGVSQPTVSYVINNTANISDEVKERVNKAIEMLHYKPNYNAIALKTQKNHVIGVIVPDITNSYYSLMASLLEKALTKSGYTVLLNSTGYKAHVETEIVKQLLMHNVEGVIITYQFSNSACWRLLKDSEKRVVTIEAGKQGADFLQIEADNFNGAYEATKYLLQQGRKKIAYIGQNSEIEALALRESGYISALQQYSVQKEPIIYWTDSPDMKLTEGRKLGEKLIVSDIDGLLVSSDEIAVGILKILISHGVKIPEEISIIGYDDIPISKLFIPELTTVAQPIHEICENAIRMLLHDEDENFSGSLVLKQKLILRQTT